MEEGWKGGRDGGAFACIKASISAREGKDLFPTVLALYPPSINDHLLSPYNGTFKIKALLAASRSPNKSATALCCG